MTTQAASALSLASALQDYPDVYLQCRGIQHRWSVVSDLHITERLNRGQLVERHLQCEHCETIRKDRFLLTERQAIYRLQVLGAVYKYPEHYLLKEMGLADHPREILRHEQMRRIIVDGAGPAKQAAPKKARARRR